LTYLTTVLADAPVHFWRCADPGGGVLNDIGSVPLALEISGSGPELAYTGPNSDGGSCVISNNVGFHYMDMESTSLPCSFEFWIFQYYRLAALQCPFAAEDNAGATMGTCRLTGAGQMQAFPPNGTLTDPTAMTTQAWHHWLLAADTAGANLYRDGGLVANAGGVAATTITCRFGIGARATPQNGNPCAAAISEGAVYHTKLSAARALAHFNAADQRTQPPISKQFGTFSLSGGIATLSADEAALILASVRKTFVNL